MLSVHGTTGQAWYHTWHGRFIQVGINELFPLLPHPRRCEQAILGATKPQVFSSMP